MDAREPYCMIAYLHDGNVRVCTSGWQQKRFKKVALVIYIERVHHSDISDEFIDVGFDPHSIGCSPFSSALPLQFPTAVVFRNHNRSFLKLTIGKLTTRTLCF